MNLKISLIILGLILTSFVSSDGYASGKGRPDNEERDNTIPPLTPGTTTMVVSSLLQLNTPTQEKKEENTSSKREHEGEDTENQNANKKFKISKEQEEQKGHIKTNNNGKLNEKPVQNQMQRKATNQQINPFFDTYLSQLGFNRSTYAELPSATQSDIFDAWVNKKLEPYSEDDFTKWATQQLNISNDNFEEMPNEIKQSLFESYMASKKK